MAPKPNRKGGKFAIDENTPEFTEAGYDEPMRHIEEDIDVIAYRQEAAMRNGMMYDAS